MLYVSNIKYISKTADKNALIKIFPQKSMKQVYSSHSIGLL